MLVVIGSAFAAPVTAHADAIVEVVATGNASTLAAVGERIRALEARLPLRVRWEERQALDARDIVAPRTHEEPAFARVWLDLTSSERALLFIANEGHDRFLVRVVPVSGYGELARESLATIVESALDALLAGGQIGVDRQAAERVIETQLSPVSAEPAPQQPAQKSAPAAAAQPTPERASVPASNTFTLALGYRGAAVDEGPALRHGVQLALDWSLAEPLWLGLMAHYFAPVALGEGAARVEQHGGGARAALGVQWPITARASWHAALGAGVDVFELEPLIEAGARLVAEAPFVVARPIATAFVGGALRPMRWLELRLSVGLDFDLAGHQFDVAFGEARRAAVSPFIVQPYLVLGAGVPW